MKTKFEYGAIKRREAIKKLMSFMCGVALFFLAASALTFCNYYYVYRRTTSPYHKTELAPTVAHFDRNRDAKPIRAIEWFKTSSTLDCPPSRPTKLALFEWPGSAAGCVDANGRLSNSSACVNITTPFTPARLNLWRDGSFFCADLADPKSAKEVRFHPFDQGTCGATHGAGWHQCNFCECYKQVPIKGTAPGTPPGLVSYEQKCPITDLKIALYSSTSPVSPTQVKSINHVDGRVILSSNTAESAAMIGLRVVIGGEPCVNPDKNPKSPLSSVYALVQGSNSSGCGSLGRDFTAKVAGMSPPTADSLSEEQFLFKENAFGMGKRATLKYYKSTVQKGLRKAKLYPQFQIQAKCSKTCYNFRFAPNAEKLFKLYVKIVERFRVLAMSWAVSGGVFLLIAACVSFVKNGKVSQTFVFLAFVSMLLTSTGLMVTLWQVFAGEYRVYQSLFQPFVNAEKLGCVVDP
jgi:hypothetical protein